MNELNGTYRKDTTSASKAAQRTAGSKQETVAPRTLSPSVRAGLDVARAVAALYVVVHHTVQIPGPAGAIFSFGQEAVLVFFLLSGFVIFANEKDRSARPMGYYLRRLRRIYPPMMVAMAISTALWATGLISQSFSVESLLGTLLAVQDIGFLKPGVVTDPYLGNDPLWSLSYEIFFYIVFPMVMVAWRRSEVATRWAVPIVSVVAYATYLMAPNHLSLVIAYFLMWWAGAMVAHLYLGGGIRVRNALPEFVGLTVLCAAAAVGVFAYGFAGLGYFPFLIFRHCAVVLVLFALLFTPVRSLLARMSSRVAGVAAAVAGISYGLYVVHYPILVQTSANESWWAVPAIAATIAAAWLADKGTDKLLPRAPRS